MAEVCDHDWLRHVFGVWFPVPGHLEGLVPAGEIRAIKGGLTYRLSEASLAVVWERYGKPRPRQERPAAGWERRSAAAG